jgi:transposase
MHDSTTELPRLPFDNPDILGIAPRCAHCSRRGRLPGCGPRVARPDRRERHFPKSCSGCSRRLSRSRRAGEPVRRQVFDVPEMTVQVTEHELHALACRCGLVIRADAPAGVRAPAVYGPNVTALAAYLSAQHHLPVGRIVEVLADVAGIEVSAGWVSEACRRAEQAVAPANEAIKDAIADAGVAFPAVPPSRSKRSGFCRASPALPSTTPTRAMTASRPARMRCVTRTRCGSWPGSVSSTPRRARTGGPWAQQMIDLLGDAHRWVAAYLRDGHTRLPDFKADDLRTRWEQTIERALRVHPPRPGKQPPPATWRCGYGTAAPSSYTSPPTSRSRSATTARSRPSA